MRHTMQTAADGKLRLHTVCIAGCCSGAYCSSVCCDSLWQSVLGAACILSVLLVAAVVLILQLGLLWPAESHGRLVLF